MKMTIHKTSCPRDFSENVQAPRLLELECPPFLFVLLFLLFESPMNIDESPLVSPVETNQNSVQHDRLLLRKRTESLG